MSTAKTLATPPPEEVKRRLAEYRRLGFERRAPAHVVYQEEQVSCPWAGCDYGIAGINFRLELQGDGPTVAQWLAAWWIGSGLVARCPACGRHVLFSLHAKKAADHTVVATTPVLPDDWHEKAHVVVRHGQ